GVQTCALPIYLRRQAVPLPDVARRAGGDLVVPAGAPAPGARHEVVHGQARRRAAVLTYVTVPGEDRPARDFTRLVTRHADVIPEADHVGRGVAAGAGPQPAGGALEHLRLLLEHQHDGALEGADVDRLVGRVQHQHLMRHGT